ncbi:DSD1 family PLP-dependent enzyme [Opitutaceae bacterium]
MPTDFASLSTPSLLLERDVLVANLDRMAARATALGVKLRPHLKTAKSAEVAALAVARGPVSGLTVSTLKEAEYFFAHGHRDLMYAVSIEPGKFARAAALIRAGARLTVTCDHPNVARSLARAGAELGVRFPTAIEIDCGEHRSGLPPDDARISDIASLLHAGPGTELVGVCTHSGHSYAGRSFAEHRAVAEDERAAVVYASEALQARNLPCPLVSLGSTPVALHAEHLKGVTEVRAGVYMFGDLFQAGIGSCRREDIAVSVLTAVIGHRPERNLLVVDAGALALSKDISTAKLSPSQNAGFGLVATTTGEIVAGLTVANVYQEHGLITGTAPIDFERFPIGSRVRILPNHSCITASAYDRYHVLAGDQIIAEWPRISGW